MVVMRSRKATKSLLVAARLIHKNSTTQEIAQRLYGAEGAEAVLKAAVSPAATNGWGGAATVGQRVAAFMGSRRGRSAFAELYARGFSLNMAGAGSVSVPRTNSAFPNAHWIGEGEPLPVFRGDFTSVSIAPKKLAALSVITNELSSLSAENAEALIEDLMSDAAGQALDSKVFSADAATTVAPAGLLHYVTPLTATSGGGVAAMTGDIAKLVSAIHAAGGGNGIALFAAPQQAVTASILAGASFKVPVVATPSLAAGSIVAIETRAFASGFSDVPRVDIGKEATLHLEDSVPAHIGTAGSPNTAAAPTRNMYQIDAIALKLVLRVAYGMRASNMVQTISGTTW
jgi:hypothetical protein